MERNGFEKSGEEEQGREKGTRGGKKRPSYQNFVMKDRNVSIEDNMKVYNKLARQKRGKKTGTNSDSRAWRE